jgi:hypothetical protein
MNGYNLWDHLDRYQQWKGRFRPYKRHKKMAFIEALIMMVFFSGLIVTGVAYVISKAISGFSFNPDSAGWKRMLDKLRKQVKDQVAGTLVPWDQEMLSLLSFNRSVVKKPGFFDNSAEGIYTTIFHEPVLAYATQQSGQNSVTVARTSDREFIFRKKERETEIWLNGHPFGLLVDLSLIAAGKSNQVLAQLGKSNADDPQTMVFIDQTEVAALANPTRKSTPNPRAVSILRTLKPEEENAVLALSVLRMTQTTWK